MADWRKRAIELYQDGVPLKEIADKLGKTFGAVNSYLYRWRKKEKLVGILEGQEEVAPDIVDYGEYYIIHTHTRTVEITKDKLKLLKQLYCEQKLTQNAVCRELDIPRRDFTLIKTAFNITKDDVPYLDEDLLECDIDKLVEESLERKKKQYFVRLEHKELEKLRAENRKYREKDYFYQKVIKEVAIPIAPLTFNIKKNILSDCEAQLNVADWHTGLRVSNFWNEYNLDIQRKRLQKLIEKTITYIHRHNVKKMHVMNLGDLLHGVIRTTSRIEAEIDVIQQLRITWQLLAEILKELAKEVEHVNFYSTYGNHSRITANKEDSIDVENLERLIPDFLREHLQNITNITIVPNKYDDQILVAYPCGHLVFGVHGDRDRPDRIASNIPMMLEMKPKMIFTAHLHHKQHLEVHKVDVIMSRSLCGIDTHAKNLRATSKAGQSLYIYTPEGLECTYDICFN